MKLVSYKMSCWSICMVLTSFSASLASAVPLVNRGDTWHYRKGTSAPPADWKTAANAGLDGTWLTGPGGFGYGDSDDATTLSDMRQVSGGSAGYTTVYIRRSFTTDGSLPSTDHLNLRMDYDDGFIAWLDGVEIARRNAPTGTEPAHTATAPTTHEASGGSSGEPAENIDLGAIQGRLSAGTHVLAIQLFNESLTSSDASLIADLSTFVSSGNNVSGTISANTTWTRANSPYCVTGALSVASGATLTIEPGVTVCVGQGITITVNGRLVAEGTEALPITFTADTAGGATSWARIQLNGAEENRFVRCVIDKANSTNIRGTNSKLYMSFCTFTNAGTQMVDMTNTSCRIEDCVFNSIPSGELLHFTTMPTNGYAIIARNIFGTPGQRATGGYNDIFDFTGGNRPGPIAQFIDNIFTSGVDDCFDMDGTDAHIEGNIFLNVRKDAARSSSSNPITCGADGTRTTELVICRNLFYNNEHAVLLKDQGTIILQNNTIVNITPNPLSNNTSAGGNEAAGVLLFGEPWRNFPFGKGALTEGNIVDLLGVSNPWPLLTEAQAAVGAFFTCTQSCINGFTQDGIGNLNANPLLTGTTGITHENIRQMFALQAGSPARGTGPNGIDMGGLVPAGATISGAPSGITASRSATVKVRGPGIWAYRWRLNGGAWSNEVSLVPQSIWNGAAFTATMFDGAPDIQLADLAEGPQVLEVQGKNSAGAWQETPYATATWTIGVANPDIDGDGLPDAWEVANGLNPNNIADAQSDADGDGLTALEEYTAGTDPRSAASTLRLVAAFDPSGQIELYFDGVVGKSYQIQVSSDLQSGNWSALQTLASLGASGPQTIADTSSTTQRRYYRLITPAP